MIVDDVARDAAMANDSGRHCESHGGALDVRGASFNRRHLLRASGGAIAFLASAGLLRTPIGPALAALTRPSGSMQSAVDVQMLQTAASLENLAVAAYEIARELPAVTGNPALREFVQTTGRQHLDHGTAFNDHAERLGGDRQDALNPRHAEMVVTSLPATTDVLAALALVATLEEVMNHTYLANLSKLEDAPTRGLMASVMCVESDHLAVLRTIDALLTAATPELIAIPTDLARLPADALSRSTPRPFEGTELASPPAEGAR